MNCSDIVLKILNNINGLPSLISSYVCKEWCVILIHKKTRYLINLYLFKLSYFVKKYEMCYYNNRYNESIFSKSNQLLQTKVIIAKMNLYSFFRQRNLKFNKYIYNGLKKIIKPYISIFIDDIENGFEIEDVLTHFCAENMILELNYLKKLC
jgi:hypothetical protein